MTPLSEAQRKKAEVLAGNYAAMAYGDLTMKAVAKTAFTDGFTAGIQHRDEPSNELNDALAAASIHAEEHRKARIKIAQLQQELAQVTANGKNAVECLHGALVASQEREKVLREWLERVDDTWMPSKGIYTPEEIEKQCISLTEFIAEVRSKDE